MNKTSKRNLLASAGALALMLAFAAPAAAAGYPVQVPASSADSGIRAVVAIDQANIYNNINNSYNVANNAVNISNYAISLASNGTGRVVGTWAYRQTYEYQCSGNGADASCPPAQASNVVGQCISGWRWVPQQEGTFYYGAGYGSTVTYNRLYDCPGGSGNQDPAH